MFHIEKKECVSAAPKKSKPRFNWPWKNMEVGDLVRIDDKYVALRAQTNCHVYAGKFGIKFSTQTIDGVLHVWRIA